MCLIPLNPGTEAARPLLQDMEDDLRTLSGADSDNQFLVSHLTLPLSSLTQAQEAAVDCEASQPTHYEVYDYQQDILGANPGNQRAQMGFNQTCLALARASLAVDHDSASSGECSAEFWRTYNGNDSIPRLDDKAMAFQLVMPRLLEQPILHSIRHQDQAPTAAGDSALIAVNASFCCEAGCDQPALPNQRPHCCRNPLEVTGRRCPTSACRRICRS